MPPGKNKHIVYCAVQLTGWSFATGGKDDAASDDFRDPVVPAPDVHCIRQEVLAGVAHRRGDHGVLSDRGKVDVET